jgi:hypothetical protein
VDVTVDSEREAEVVALLRRAAPRDAPDQETRDRMRARLLAELSVAPPTGTVRVDTC